MLFTTKKQEENAPTRIAPEKALLSLCISQAKRSFSDGFLHWNHYTLPLPPFLFLSHSLPISMQSTYVNTILFSSNASNKTTEKNETIENSKKKPGKIEITLIPTQPHAKRHKKQLCDVQIVEQSTLTPDRNELLWNGM